MPIDINETLNTLSSGASNSTTIGDYSTPSDTYTSRLINEEKIISKEKDDEYIKYGVDISRYNDIEEANRERARNQAWTEQLGRSLAQIGYNEIFLGGIKGLFDTFDALVNIGNQIKAYKNGDEYFADEYTNVVSKFLEEAQDKFREKTAIYQENPNAAWQVGDFGWWAANLVNVGSTVSLLIPAFAGGAAMKGIRAGLNLATKGTKASRWFNNTLRSVSKVGGKNAKPLFHANIAQANINKFVDDVAVAAFMSRTAENYQEARETYKQEYDKALNYLNQLSDSDLADFIAEHPKFEGKSRQDIAKGLSSDLANEVFINDYSMLLMDMLEFQSLSKIFKGGTTGKSSAKLRISNRNAIAQLEGKEAESLGFLSRAKESIKYNIREHPIEFIKSAPWNEAIEEGFQAIQQQKAENTLEMMFDKGATYRTLDSYLTDGHVWEQAFWGVLGGIAFQGVGRGIKTSIHNIEDKKAEKKYNEIKDNVKELANFQDTYRNRQLHEIEGRKERLDLLINRINSINEGKAVDRFGNTIFETDKLGNTIKDENGISIEKTLNEEEQATAKLEAIQDFVTDSVFDAVDNNTYDLLLEYINNPIFKKYLKEQGIKEDEIDTIINNNINDYMEDAHEQYLDNISKIFNNANIDAKDYNDYAVRILARQMSRDKINYDNNTVKYNDTFSKISENNESLSEEEKENFEEFLEIQRLHNIQANIEEAKKSLDKAEKRYKEGNITKEALDAYRKEIIPYISQEFERLNKSKGELETTKKVREESNKIARELRKVKEFTENETTTISRLLNDLHNSLNEEFKDRKYKEPSIVKNNKELIQNLFRLESELSHYENAVPKSNDDLKYNYLEFYNELKDISREKYKAYIEEIKDYLKESKNVDSAWKDLISGNVNDKLKEALKVLKLGHERTIDALVILSLFKDNEIKRRKEEAKKADTVTINGEEKSQKEIDAKKKVDDAIPSTGEEKEAQESETAKEYKDYVEQYDESIKEQEPKSDDVLLANQSKEAEDDWKNIQNVVIEPTTKEKNIEEVGRKVANLWSLNSDNLNELFKEIGNVNLSDVNYNRIFTYLMTNLNDESMTTDEKKLVILEQMRIKASELALKNKTKGHYLFRKLTIKIDGIKIANSLSSSTTSIEKGTKKDKINLFSNIIDSYFKLNEKSISTNLFGEKLAVIDFNNFLDYLYNISGLGHQNLITILNSIINDNLIEEYNKNNNHIKFDNTKQLEKYKNKPQLYIRDIIQNKFIEANIDPYMHANIPSSLKKPIKRDNFTKKELEEYNKKLEEYNKKLSEYNKAAKLARKGNPIYFKVNKKNNNISIYTKVDGKDVEIGYLGTVESDDNGTLIGYKTSGFVYKINSSYDLEGFDDLFYSIIVGNEKELVSLLSIYRNITKKEQADFILNHPIIRKLIKDGYIILKEEDKNGKAYSYIQKANKVFEDLKNIFSYEHNKFKISNFNSENKVSRDTLIASYTQWKQRIYNNYKSTKEIQDKKEGEIKGKLISFGIETANETKESRDIKDIAGNLNEKINPLIAVVDNSGTIACENPNIKFPTIGKTFKVGTMGVLLNTVNGYPIFGLFDEANTISSNTYIAELIKEELIEILTNFTTQKDNKNIDGIVNALGDLIGSTGKYGKSNIAFGVDIINRDGNFITIKKRNSEKAIVLIETDEKTKEIEDKDKKKFKRAIYYYKDKKTKKYYNNLNDDSIKEIVNEIVSWLSFNKSFDLMLENSVNQNNYLRKENGKIILKIGSAKNENKGKGIIYDSYYDFIFKNNAFKTKLTPNSAGELLNYDNSNGIYVDVNYKEQEYFSSKFIGTTFNIYTAIRPLFRAPRAKGANLDKILSRLGIDKSIIDLWFSSLEEGLPPLLDKKIYYRDSFNEELNSPKAADAEYLTEDNKIKITSKGINRIASSEDPGYELLRLIVHENIHQKVNNLKVLEEKETINALLETLRQFTEAVKNNDKYKDLQNWIAENNFEKGKFIGANGEIAKDRELAEEWLVESLTRPEIVKALNEITYEGTVEQTEKKSLFQRIIDLILKLFGKNIDNIKNNSILAKQYSIFNDKTVKADDAEQNIKTEQETEVKQEPEVKQESKKEDEEDDYNDEDDLEIPEAREKTEEEKEFEEEHRTLESSTSPIIHFDNNYKENEEIKNNKEEITINSTELYEDNIETFDNNTDVNPNGYMNVPDMDKFVSMFPHQIQPKLAKLVENGTIKYLCR